MAYLASRGTAVIHIKVSFDLGRTRLSFTLETESRSGSHCRR
jgi:hypothetical protein